MPWWAPFQLTIIGPDHRPQTLRIDFRHLPLHQFERFPFAKLRITFQQSQRILARAEAVHEKKPERNSMLPPQKQNLPGNQVEESPIVFYREQRFGAFESHARAQPTIEFYNSRLREKFRLYLVLLRNVFESRQFTNRLNAVLRDQPARACDQALVIVLERRDRCVA